MIRIPAGCDRPECVALIGLYLVVRGVRLLRAEREDGGSESRSAAEDQSN